MIRLFSFCAILALVAATDQQWTTTCESLAARHNDFTAEECVSFIETQTEGCQNAVTSTLSENEQAMEVRSCLKNALREQYSSVRVAGDSRRAEMERLRNMNPQERREHVEQRGQGPQGNPMNPLNQNNERGARSRMADKHDKHERLRGQKNGMEQPQRQPRPVRGDPQQQDRDPNHPNRQQSMLKRDTERRNQANEATRQKRTQGQGKADVEAIAKNKRHMQSKLEAKKMKELNPLQKLHRAAQHNKAEQDAQAPKRD